MNRRVETETKRPPTDRRTPSDQTPWWRLHLWEITPFRDLLVAAIICTSVYLALAVPALSVPLALAFVGAYAIDPVVSATERRWAWPRWIVSSLVVALGVAAVATVSSIWGPQLVSDTRELLTSAGGRLDDVQTWLFERLPSRWRDAVAKEQSPVRPSQLFSGALSALNLATAFVAVSGYTLAAVIFGTTMFVVFSAKMPTLGSLKDWFPKSRRSSWSEYLDRFESIFAGYFRGQLLVAAFTTIAFAVGFEAIGVPYALSIAFVGGAFSIVPNGQVAGPLLAIGVSLAHDVATTYAVALPLLVYACTQSLETFVVTPAVQSSHTRMPAVWVLGALIAGGTVAGVAGVFFAIPVTACLRLLVFEVVAPRLRTYLENT